MTLSAPLISGPRQAVADSHAVAPFATVDLEQLLPAFEQLVVETVAQVEACPAKSDPTFLGYESLLAAIRSATTLEGTLLEKGIALVAVANPDLVLVQLERPLPVHETAKAVFRRNDWARASGLRLDSEVATREFYKPDLLIVAGGRQLALIIDVKRSVSSYKPRALAELRSRMMASALVVRDVLERDHDAPPVARADIAIIDGASECRDEARGVFALADLDWLLQINGAASAIERLRDLYGDKVRAVLDARCRAIIVPRSEQRGEVVRGVGRVRGNDDPELATSGQGTEEARPKADEDDAGESDGSTLQMPGSQLAARNRRPRITVGIASRGAH
ncbi:hypothetical protein JYU29_12335 [Tianweitania sp. BSSL-BM11]|uniref:Restriction endonuclease n=1 Tax=Tianweitania aestuarii TaxID=2814886 RepID=A0ABS5RWP2_9HYPH|nr:hypothetical protein [Tianweitania aestuarii]MBS9721473.1 hypothetical protein [Tianweitania aestuarii]